MKSLSRRKFMVLMGLAGLGIASGPIVLWPKRRAIYNRLFRPEYEITNAALPEDSLNEIQALGDLIYAPSNDEQAGQLHEIVSRWVRERTEIDGLHDLYQAGLEQLRETVSSEGYQQPFHLLSAAEQMDIMRSLGLAPEDTNSVKGPLIRWLGHIDRFRQREARYFIQHMKNDLVRGIFSSQLGWQRIGYTTWPGIPGERWEYTRVPEPMNSAIS